MMLQAQQEKKGTTASGLRNSLLSEPIRTCILVQSFHYLPGDLFRGRSLSVQLSSSVSYWSSSGDFLFLGESGRPSWSSPLLSSSLPSCPAASPLRVACRIAVIESAWIFRLPAGSGDDDGAPSCWGWGAAVLVDPYVVGIDSGIMPCWVWTIVLLSIPWPVFRPIVVMTAFWIASNWALRCSSSSTTRCITNTNNWDIAGELLMFGSEGCGDDIP